MTRVTLVPTTQYVGTLPPGWIQDNTLTPSPFGSVTDGSDATYTTLSGRGDPVDSSLLSLTFNAPAEAQQPAWMYMQIRARNTAWHLANPGAQVYIETLYLAGADDTYLDNWVQTFDGSAPGNDYQLAPLAGGRVSSPQTFNFYFLGDFHDVDPADPYLSDTWKNLGGFGSGPAMFDALLSPEGLRVGIWCHNTDLLDTTLRDYLDVFEVRLVLDYASATVPPACLLYPRTDDLGINGGVIYPPPDTQQYGLRTGSSAPL